MIKKLVKSDKCYLCLKLLQKFRVAVAWFNAVAIFETTKRAWHQIKHVPTVLFMNCLYLV